MACGTVLDDFNYQALDGYSYCDPCIEEQDPEVYRVSAFLANREWYGLVREVTGILWLAPVERRFWCLPIYRLAVYQDAIKAAELEAGKRQLLSDAEITVRLARANRRLW